MSTPTIILIVAIGIGTLAFFIQLLFRWLSFRAKTKEIEQEKIANGLKLDEYSKKLENRISIQTGVFNLDRNEKISDIYVNQKLVPSYIDKLISSGDLLRKEKNSLVIGDPGLGKSMLAKKLSLMALSEGKIVIFIDAYEVVDVYEELGAEHFSLFGYINQYHPDVINVGMGGRFINAVSLASSNQAPLVVIDGLDEIPASSTRILLTRISEFSREFREYHLICTARPTITDLLSSLNDFEKYDLQPLNVEKDIRPFIAKRIEGTSEKSAYKKIKTLIDSSERLRDLLRKPLFLELCIMLLDNEQFEIDDRHSLLMRAINHMLRRAQSSDYYLERSGIRFSLEQRRSFLGKCARKLVEDDREILSLNEAREIAEKMLKGDQGYTALEAKQAAPNLIQDAQFNASLLTTRSLNISFVHRMIRDVLFVESLGDNAEQFLLENIGNSTAIEPCLLILEANSQMAETALQKFDKENKGHRRLFANVLANNKIVDENGMVWKDVIHATLDEPGVHFLHRVALINFIKALAEDDRESTVSDMKKSFRNHPNILVLIDEVERSEFPNQTSGGENGKPEAASIRVIGEKQEPMHALEQLVINFEDVTKHKVEITLCDVTEIAAELKDLGQGDEEKYDVIIQPHRKTGYLASNGLVTPLSRFISRERHFEDFNPEQDIFQDWWKETGWYNGVCYGIPIVALTITLWYRKDLFENGQEKENYFKKYGTELRVPTSIEELTQVSDFFHRPAEDIYGFALQGGAAPEHNEGEYHPCLYHDWLNFLYAFNGRVLEQDYGWEYGPIALTSPNAINATLAYLQLYSKNRCHSDSQEMNWDDVATKFREGKFAMCAMWNDAVYRLLSNKDEDDKKSFGFTLFPSNELPLSSQSDGWSMFIPENCKNKDAAFDFIEWSLSKSIQREMQLKGGASPLIMIYQDEEVKKLPYTEVTTEAIRTRVPRETIPEAEAVWQAITKSLLKLLQRDEKLTRKAVEEELQALASELEISVLDKKTYVKIYR